MHAVWFIIFVLIGYLFDVLGSLLLVLLFFTPIRLAIDGYHSKNKVKCLNESIIIILPIVYLLKCFPRTTVFSGILFSVTVICLWQITGSNILSDSVIKTKAPNYSKTTKVLMVAEVFVSILLVGFRYENLLFEFSIANLLNLVLATLVGINH